MERWKIIALAIGGVAALALVFALLWTDKPSDEPPEATPAAPSQSTASRIPRTVETPSAAPSATPTEDSEHGTTGSSDEKAQITVANGFWDAWVQQGTPEERAARIGPWATPEEVEIAQLVGNDALPTGTRVGDAVVDPASEESLIYTFINLSDGGQWRVSLVKDPTTPHGWAASEIQGFSA